MNPKLQIVLCPGRFPDPQYQALYDQIYNCWHEVWSETLKELEGLPRLHSDTFTRQDLACGFFVDGVCKALTLFRYMDANHITMERDSYFANWSKEHIAKLASRGSNILVCSNFTIHPSVRKDTLGFSLKDLLVGLSSEVILQSNAHVMTGAMRKNRNVHEATYRWGAIPLGIDIDSGHGDCLVDLVGFFPMELRATHHELNFLVKKLWKERLVIELCPPQTVNSFQTAEAGKTKIRKAG